MTSSLLELNLGIISKSVGRGASLVSQKDDRGHPSLRAAVTVMGGTGTIIIKA
jgi:hypothetical protein